jgi:hypothetical protein
MHADSASGMARALFARYIGRHFQHNFADMITRFHAFMR